MTVNCRIIPPPSIPPHKGEGDVMRRAKFLPIHVPAWAKRDGPESPSPLWGGIKGGGDSTDIEYSKGGHLPC